MANLRVMINSKEMVKPSSPTSKLHKTVQLSSLDQSANPFWVPFIFFYNPSSIGYTIGLRHPTTLLKISLSETLVQFYPLAGRIVGNSSINCNDEGVLFYEASVLASLVQVIESPNNPEELLRLLPFPHLNSTNKTIVAGIQVNHFSCGQIAISVCISHKIVDGASIIAFVNAWANKTHGDSDNQNSPQVKFDSVSLFPQRDPNKIHEDPEGGICKENIVTKRLIFNKKKVDTLKEQCFDRQQVNPPTRVGVVSAFLWKHFIKAARMKPNPPKIFGATQVVNLRKIKSSPIPGDYHGNLFWTVPAHALVGAETKYSELVDKLRTAVKKIDTSSIEKIQSGKSLLESQKAYENLTQGETDFCFISDLSKFPFYEVNFGWGKPIWVSMTTLPFKNTVFLMGTKCGQGIEAWVHVLEKDIVALEKDYEFFSLAHRNVQARMKIC